MMQACAYLRKDGAEDGRDCPSRRGAMEWLRELLKNGPLGSAEVRREADSAGFAWRTVHRAKDDLGICPTRADPLGSWVWRLPSA